MKVLPYTVGTELIFIRNNSYHIGFLVKVQIDSFGSFQYQFADGTWAHQAYVVDDVSGFSSREERVKHVKEKTPCRKLYAVHPEDWESSESEEPSTEDIKAIDKRKRQKDKKQELQTLKAQLQAVLRLRP